MDISNNLLAVLVIIAVAVSISGTMTTMSLIGGSVPITGFAQTTATGTAQVELESVASIELVVNAVDFGTIESTPDTTNDTTDFSPHPFVVKNNGSVVINISTAEDSGDALWINDNSNARMILCSGTNHGGTANIDIFQSIGEGHVRFGNGLFKRIKIYNDHIDLADTMLCQFSEVLISAFGQDSAMNIWMQRLDTAAKNFREPCDL